MISKSDATRAAITLIDAANDFGIKEAEMRWEQGTQEQRDEVLRGVTATLESVGFESWQLIADAPKDRLVLVYPSCWPGNTCDLARYNSDKYAKKPRPFWERTSPADITTSRANPPTHFMLLPTRKPE